MASFQQNFFSLVVMGCVKSDSDVHDVRDEKYVDEDMGAMSDKIQHRIKEYSHPATH